MSGFSYDDIPRPASPRSYRPASPRSLRPLSPMRSFNPATAPSYGAPFTLNQLRDLARDNNIDLSVDAGTQPLSKSELVEVLLENGVLTVPMTIPELRNLARQSRVMGYSGKTKFQLIRDLMNAGVLSPASIVVAQRPTYEEPVASYRPVSPRQIPKDPRQMTILELRNLSKQYGLKGYSMKTKAELIQLLIDAGVFKQKL